MNSYARILNGPKHLVQIGQFNELAASIATLRQEKEELEQGVKEKKRLLLAAKTERKAERDHKIHIEQVEKGPGCKADVEGPGCKADVEMGLEHVLLLSNTRRKEILRVHFGLVAGVH